MKILLIKAPYLDIYGKLNIGGNHYFPLGIGYIASWIKKNGYKDVGIFDPEAQGLNRKEIKSFIKNTRPDIVGITASTPNIENAFNIANIIKELFPNVPVVVGGAHASALPEHTLKNFNSFDVAVFGEGENTFLEILKAYESNRGWTKIRGICFKDEGKIIRNDPRNPVEDIDQIPFPSRELVNLKWYRPQANLHRKGLCASMITSRGCPFSCTFCAVSGILGKRIRFNSPEYIIEEIEHLINKYGVNYIHFEDDVFTLNHTHLEKILDLILIRKIKFRWWCLSRVDNVDEKLLKLMKRAGCDCISYGIESGNEDIQIKIGKNINKQKAMQTLGLTRKLGIESQCFFIIGFPGETKENAEETVRFSIKLNPVYANFSKLVPFPGTEVYDSYFKEKIKFDGNWKKYSAVGGSFDGFGNEYMNGQDIAKIVKKAYRIFYFRAGKIIDLAKTINSPEKLWALMRGSWGLFREVISNY